MKEENKIEETEYNQSTYDPLSGNVTEQASSIGESKKSVLKHKELSLSNWVLTLFIASLPLVGFVMLFVWSFSDNPHPVRSKWAKATLILMGIGILIALFLILIMASFASSAVVRYY